MQFGQVIDAFALMSAVAAAFLWLAASRNTLRRISRKEVIDAADLNRIVISINRAQILNARAALMTALSTILVSCRYAINYWPGVGP